MGGRRKNRMKRKEARESVKNERHFTLDQAARNTEQHSIFRHPNRQLRYSKVQFVSSGEMKPADFNIPNTSEEKEDETRRPVSRESDHSPPGQENTAAYVETDLDATRKVDSLIRAPDSVSLDETVPDDLFFLDSKGDDSLRKSDVPNPIIKCDSPTPTDSSEDEIVFAGRRSLPRRVKLPSVEATRETVTSVQHSSADLPVLSASAVCSNVESEAKRTQPISNPPSPNSFEMPTSHIQTGKRYRRRHRGTRHHSDDEDLEVIMDYIQHMDASSDSEDTDSETDIIYHTPDSVEIPMEGLSDKHDFPPVNAAPNPDIARSFVDSLSEDKKIAAQFSFGKNTNEAPPSRPEGSDSTNEDDVELLSIFPDEPMAEDAADFQFLLNLAGEMSPVSDGFPSHQTVRGKKRGAKTKKRDYHINPSLSASQYADLFDENYGDFDIMDFDRPSLKKGKSKKAPDFGLSDSDLEWNMKSTWENDRAKKKLKKKEREELRFLGLLTKSGKVNMNAKYANGIDPLEIKDEIRQFLLSSIQTLSLPPMPKKERKLVHEMANVLSLKSISRGNGAARFPVLTKTKHTPGFSSHDHGSLDALMNKGRIMRRYGKRNVPVKRTAVKSRGNTKPAAYTDGDVVGASAPEIGADNRGRAMLERMGWNTGTALGAQNNKGILQPVVHVVKTNKAGLG